MSGGELGRRVNGEPGRRPRWALRRSSSQRAPARIVVERFRGRSPPPIRPRAERFQHLPDCALPAAAHPDVVLAPRVRVSSRPSKPGRVRRGRKARRPRGIVAAGFLKLDVAVDRLDAPLPGPSFAARAAFPAREVGARSGSHEAPSPASRHPVRVRRRPRPPRAADGPVFREAPATGRPSPSPSLVTAFSQRTQPPQPTRNAETPH